MEDFGPRRSSDLWRFLFPSCGRRGSAGGRVCWDPCAPVLLLRRRRPLQRRCGICEMCAVGWRSSGFSSLLRVGDDLNLLVLCSSSPSSCGHAEAEIDDFPSVVMLPEDTRFPLAPGGSGGGGPAARLRSASVVAEEWVPGDLVVFSLFFGFCTAMFG